MPNVYRDQARLRTDVVAGPTLTFKVGDTVQKDFHGVTWIGTIVSISDGLYHVRYEHGDHYPKLIHFSSYQHFSEFNGVKNAVHLTP